MNSKRNLDTSNLRQKYQNFDKQIKKNDKGAGSLKNDTTVASICKNASIPDKYGTLLKNLIESFGCEYIIELGTSLGIGTSFLARGKGVKKVITIDADETILGIAREHLMPIYSNIEFLVGEFETQLPLALEKLPRLDLVYFDGNHQKIPTLDYFHLCLPHIHERTIFVFDDIYWSEGMTEAWKQIKAHPQVVCTVDLYRFGLVFFNHEMKAKSDFVIYY